MTRQKIFTGLVVILMIFTFMPTFALENKELHTLKVGLKEAQGRDIVIHETQGGMFKRGELLIRVEAPLAFNKKQILQITTTEGLKVEVEEITDNEIILNVLRTSNKTKPGSIILSNILFDVGYNVPEGRFDITMTGSALADTYTYDNEGKQSKEDIWVIDEYLVVADSTTEDVTDWGMRDRVASFTEGEELFVVNGVQKDMDVSPYISAGNRMMVPFRYVGEAFGIDGNNIIFSNSTVTMLAGTRTIQLTKGSDAALLNGAPVKMEEAMVIKEDRTYIPIGEVAKLLGVKTVWDNDTKIATFSNEK